MNKKLNNKGFSLVELIIVIAIMVVLIGVLSATILKYMDRTKYGKDMSGLDSLHTAVQAYMGDPEAITPSGVVSLKTLMLGDGTTVYDPNGVIESVLQESFKITKSGNVITGCIFAGESKMFENINWEDILVDISEGAISIVAPVNEGYNSKYVPYTVGKHEWTDEQKVKEN